MTGPQNVPDLRLSLLGLAAWAGALEVRWEPGASIPALVMASVAAAVAAVVAGSVPRHRRPALTVVAMLTVGAGVGGVAVHRAAAVRDG